MAEYDIHRRGTLRAKTAELASDTPRTPMVITEHEDGRVTVELAAMPAVLYVSHCGLGTFDELYVHGEQQVTNDSYTITSAVGELTTLDTSQRVAIIAKDK